MPEHPYTKLLNELDGAYYVRFDKETGLIYAWNGARRVEVLNTEGACADFFGVPDGATVPDVAKAIEEHMAEEREGPGA